MASFNLSDVGTIQKTHNVVVDIAEMKISNNPGDMLVTYALGSCLGIALYDSVSRVAGLAHIMLPESSIDSKMGKDFNPLKYVDTGIPALYKKMYSKGAEKHRIKNAIIGGAQIMDDNGFFNIGKRNYTALRKIFWRNNVLIDKEHVGGRINRTVRLEVRTGNIYVKLSSGGTIQL